MNPQFFIDGGIFFPRLYLHVYIGKEELTAVFVVCRLNGFHSALIEVCLQQGTHVFC